MAGYLQAVRRDFFLVTIWRASWSAGLAWEVPCGTDASCKLMCAACPGYLVPDSLDPKNPGKTGPKNFGQTAFRCPGQKSFRDRLLGRFWLGTCRRSGGMSCSSPVGLRWPAWLILSVEFTCGDGPGDPGWSPRSDSAESPGKTGPKNSGQTASRYPAGS